MNERNSKEIVKSLVEQYKRAAAINDFIFNFRKRICNLGFDLALS